MQRIPGPRANPTIKPLATMNKKNLRVWEIKIGLTQLVVLIGAVSGSLLCAFLLGYFSGQRVGFEGALASTMANVARMPVAAERNEDSNVDDVVSEVYARLGEEGASDLGSDLKKGANEAAAKIEDLPDLSGIKKLAQAEKIEELNLPQKIEANAAVINERNQNEARKSLGSLVEEQKPADKESAAESVPQVEVLEPLLDKAKTEKDITLAKIDRSEEVAKELLKGAEKTQQANKNLKLEVKPQAIQKEEKLALLNNKSKLEAKEAKSTDSKTAALNKSQQISTVPKLSKGWFAQVAAPRKRTDADAIVSKLRSSGFRVSIENANVRGEEYFRVMVGPEDNRQMAERLVDQLKREKYLKSDPFVRLVK